MRRLPGFPAFLMFAAAALLFTLPPTPAKADSFFFGISGGDRHRHHHRHHYRHRHHQHHGYYRPHYWSGYHHVYRPPVVIAPPPVIYHAPPPVVYSAPPVVSAIPSSPVYQAADGQYCREYQGTVTVNGRAQPSYGTACLMPDGAWRVVN